MFQGAYTIRKSRFRKYIMEEFKTDNLLPMLLSALVCIVGMYLAR